MAKTFVITLIKGKRGCSHSQRATMEAMGLRRIHQSVTMADNPANRGQITKIHHLITVEVQR